LETRAGSIEIVPKFQKLPQNDALKSGISFAEERRNYKGPNQMSNQSAAPIKQCWQARCHGVATSPNLLLFPMCKADLLPRTVAKSPSSIAGYSFGLEETIHHKNIPSE
jgi:hypothetical protein